jgi:hypothetical protein
MMKLLLASLVITLFSTHLHAEEINPAGFCNETGMCTKKMISITQTYEKGNADFQKEALSAFSGACYHLSDLYDPEHEHHGAFVFSHDEVKPADLMTTGVFSFFAESDPYAQMSSVELKDWFIKNNSRFDKTIVKADHVELQYLTELSNYTYWFRQDARAKKLILIGKQIGEDSFGYIFCELKKHK